MKTKNLISIVVVAVAFLLTALPALARSLETDAAGFSRTLKTSERRSFESYFKAKTIFDHGLDKFWARVKSKRSLRRKLKAKGRLLTEANYVNAYPPTYKGPGLSKSLKSRWWKYRVKLDGKKPPKKKKTLPTIEDFLAYSRAHYGFRPERVPERTFKRRYAAEALRLGLTKEQVVRVYALETSGLGRADMVAGMGRASKRKSPISTAIGYAQLLVANTIEQLYLHGSDFATRLERMSRRQGITSARKRQLLGKVVALKKMVRYVKSHPKKWGTMLKMSRTAKGRGVHAINVDGDIGPWLQVIKLKGIKGYATRAGRHNLASHQLELMNLAGPGTGLEMMTSVGLGMPTVNFFARRAYGRNTIARGKTSRQLLKALAVRMDENMVNSGAKEFNAAFDYAAARR